MYNWAMKQELQLLLEVVLRELGLEGLAVTITPTADPSHGDYATNIAFQAAKKLAKHPMEVASLIAKDKRLVTNKMFAKIEVASPGFVNFTLGNTPLIQGLQNEHKMRASSSLKKKKIMIEFTDPNPFKEFHIGHLYSNIVGESVARILEANGAEVRRVCYQGDVGLHVAKAIYGLQEKINDVGLTVGDLEKKPLIERVRILGEAYALGAWGYEEDSTAKQEIIEINKKVYVASGAVKGSNDPEISEVYKKGRQWSLEYFESIYQRLGTKFEDYYFESEAGPVGVDLVKRYKDTVFEQGENGAIIFEGEKYGLHTRVFINSLGLPTYEAKELGLAVTKYSDYKFDTSIMITGNEINEYFKVLLKALSLIEPEISQKMKHLSHGMVRLPEGKMSSRTGNVLTGEWLMDEAVSRARDKIKETKDERGDSSARGVYPKEAERIAQMVGLGAVKWALLRSGIGRDVEFSFDESVSFEGNSGPYLQYTYVRTRSVLEKADSLGVKLLATQLVGEKFDTLSSEERRLLVLLLQYSDIVLEAAEKYSPNIISTYLFQLAQEFNLFYQKHSILKEEGDARILRIMLTKKVGLIIKDGLNLLGIRTPEKM